MAKNWLDKYDNGGETPANYNSIPTGIVKPPTVIPTSGSSYYEPSEQTIYLNPTAYYNDPSVYQHEMFHHWQNLNDQLRKPDEYQGPLAKPSMLSNNTGDYYNRRTVETDKEYNDFYKDNPSFKIVNPNLIYNGVINPSLYENPKYAEGEAEDYQYYVKGGGRPAFMAKGGLIKRADGSYSKRGLWDNIRANRGSGRKPTAEMLEQERKIKKHADGSFVEGEDPKTNKVQGNNPLMNLSEAQRFPAPVQTTVTYPEGYVNQMFDLKNPVLNTMGKPYATGAVEQSVSPLDFIGAAKGVIGLGKGLLKYRNLMKPNYVELGGQMIDIGAHPRAVNRAVNQMHKGAQQVALPSPFADGSWVEDSSLPTPTTPSFYPAGKDRTLTNYQMGTPKARMYAAGSTVWTKQNTPLWAAGTPTPTATQNFRNTGSLNTDLYRIGDVIPTGMNYKTPAAGTYDYNKDVQPYYKTILHAPDTTMMAKHGSHVTSDYKKRVGIPYAISPGVSDAGMYVGPTTQRGITFANGGWINKYETAGFVTDGENDGKGNGKTPPKKDQRKIPQTGVVVDKRTGQAIVMGPKNSITFPVLTGQAGADANVMYQAYPNADMPVNQRVTPTGYYVMDNNISGASHYDNNIKHLKAIPAFGTPAAANVPGLAIHQTYNPEYRNQFYTQPADKRYQSYGCVNCRKPDYLSMMQTLGGSDTVLVVDSKNAQDAILWNQANQKYKSTKKQANGGWIEQYN